MGMARLSGESSLSMKRAFSSKGEGSDFRDAVGIFAISEKSFGEPKILAYDGPDGQFQCMRLYGFFDEVGDVRGNTHIHDVIAGVPRDHHRILGCPGTLTGNLIQEIKGGFLVQVYIQNEYGHPQLFLFSKSQRLVKLRERVDIPPCIETLQGFCNQCKHLGIVIQHDDI
jgi:hypothetical protein